MIKLYIGSSCSSSRRAKRWLITHDIPFIEQNLIRQPLTKNEFIHLLKLTNNGVTEMLSTHSISYKNLVHRIDELSLSELYIEIRTSPSLLKKPIIYDQPAKLLTGFSEDKIRMFLPKTKRKQELNELLLSGHLVDFKENNLCVPVISCFSNMLVNKNNLAKLQLRQAIQHSRMKYSLKNLSFYSILNLLLLFFISLDGRENENSLLLQSK